jgi:hypothetical protein
MSHYLGTVGGLLCAIFCHLLSSCSEMKDDLANVLSYSSLCRGVAAGGGFADP